RDRDHGAEGRLAGSVSDRSPVRNSGRSPALANSRYCSSHTFAVLSSLAEARSFPSRLNATDRTGPACPFSVAVFFPVAGSHSSTVLLFRPTASVLPSGENARHHGTFPHLSFAISRPITGSHSRTVASFAPAASVLPSGE